MSAAAPPVLVLVDGSNVARCGTWRARNASGADDAELRRRLVDALCSWAPVAGVEVHVVFDGAGPWRAGKVRASADVVVIGSGRADGDEVIERRASNAHRAARTLWLATSDRALQQVAGARAERVLRADDFAAQLTAGGRDRDDDVPGGPPSARSQVRASLDEDTLARLERLRRGLDP